MRAAVAVSRPRALAVAAVACLAAIAFAMAFPLTEGGDYSDPFCAERRCGDAAPAIDALQRGQLGEFFREQPAMGPFSLVVRAPAAAIARGLGGDEDWQYRAGAVVCMLAAAALAIALALLLMARGVPWVGWLPLAALCIVNPANGDALQRGHPEEVLGAALLAGAALAAVGTRALVAGVLLGCALATKQWAWLGLLPIALMAPAARRGVVALAAVAVVALLTAPMAVGNFSEFRDATDAAANPPGTVKPLDIWFPFADERVVTVESDGARETRPVWEIAPALDDVSHPLVLAVAVALTALWWRRGQRASGVWLLAALLLIRVIGDPHAHPYHHAPFMLALAAAEALVLKGFPWRTVSASALLAVSLRLFDAGDWQAANVLYLLWALPAAALLARWAIARPARVER